MRAAMFTIVAALCAALGGCSGNNQALMASGGRQDFAAMQRVSDEYGDEPDATVPVTSGETENVYRVWIGKTKQRIMVQTASVAGIAAAGLVRGLTAGLVQGDIEYEPIEQAAKAFLASTRGPNCMLANSRKLTHVGWEWDFSCAPMPTQGARLRR